MKTEKIIKRQLVIGCLPTHSVIPGLFTNLSNPDDHLLIHSLTHSLTLSLTHLFTHTLTHSISHSLTYSLTHSLIVIPALMTLGKDTAHEQLNNS